MLCLIFETSVQSKYDSPYDRYAIFQVHIQSDSLTATAFPKEYTTSAPEKESIPP